jgi:hypothetical protein
MGVAIEQQCAPEVIQRVRVGQAPFASGHLAAGGGLAARR